MKKILYLLVLIIFIFSGCSRRERGVYYESVVYKKPGNKPTQNPYSVNGRVYFPKNHVPIGWTQRGIASWYGPNFHGKYTSNGEIYNMYDYTCLLYTSPSPRDRQKSRMPSSA
jgi:rare lipoprotein A